METIKLLTNQEIRRDAIKQYLLEKSHYNKKRLVLGAKNRGLFGFNQDDNEVYDTLVRFSDYHKIKIHTTPPEIKEKSKEENSYIEEIDENGESKLKKLNFNENKNNDEFVANLIKQRDILSEKLLKINNLIKTYIN